MCTVPPIHKQISLNKEFVVEVKNLKIRCYVFKQVVTGFVVLENLMSGLIVQKPLKLDIENSGYIELEDCRKERFKFLGVLPAPPKTYQLTVFFDKDGGDSYKNERVLGVLHPDEDRKACVSDGMANKKQ